MWTRQQDVQSCGSEQWERERAKEARTYVGKDTHHVQGTASGVVKVDIRLELALVTQVGNVSDSVDGAPSNNGGTQPSMHWDDLSVGETNGMEHGTTQDQEQDYTSAGDDDVSRRVTHRT
jgi:hypothetical protein